MPLGELVRYSPDRPRDGGELLGRNVDFQTKYNNALGQQGGLEVVHRRELSEPRDILCMDEGLIPLSQSTVRLAGPVPLLQRTLPILQENVTKGVVYGRVFDHDSCGALGLNLAALGEGMDIDPKKAGAVLASRFAKVLTSEYADHQVEYGGRLPLMRRPERHHTGQIVYYDARQAGLDTAHIATFDPGYTISRGIFGPDAAREYSELALGIAFGDHGLGSSLTSDTPLHLVGIADEQSNMGKIMDELRLIQQSRGQDAERIEVHIVSA